MSREDNVPEAVLAVALRYGLSLTEPPQETGGAEAERECNLLLAALKETLDEQEANKRAHTAEVQRADQWLERVNRAPKEREAWLRNMLRAVAPFVPRFGKKSRDLPHGTIGWRKHPERLTVENEEQVLGWARHNCIRVNETVSVYAAELAKAWKDRRKTDPAFVPPGCKVVDAEETFYANPSEVG